MKKFFFRPKFRLILWVFIIAIVSIVLFIISGYKSAQTSVSYLPKDFSTLIDSMPSSENQVNLNTPWYDLVVDQAGRIAVKTTDGKIIISSLTYYAQFEGEKDSWGLKNVSIKLINDSTIEIKGNNSKNVQVDLLLSSYNYVPKIDVHIKTHYTTNTLVQREALVASFDVPVSAVYLKNRKVDRRDFEPEYWLEKEGVRFGNNERSALIYHTPAVSSLQLQTSKKLLFINLDYSLDHPLVKIPYQKVEGGKWVNLSESDCLTGYKQDNSFSINIGSFQKSIPRLMLVPDGYKAGYIFTEHADGGNIRTQRAAYFGSEDITNAKEATGGFVFYKIPVTKSIFYIGTATPSGASVYEDGKVSPLLNFLDQLYATGLYDLCLHTPENATSNRKALEESIKFMKERYNTVSWIDHGFYGGKLNREATVCDGLDSSSQFYAVDIWGKYDTKYFWSPAVEMIKNSKRISVTENLKRLKFYKAYVTFLQHYLSPKDLRELNLFQLIKELKKNYSYRLELNTLEYNSGNAQPTPLFWQHLAGTKELYFWATDQEKQYGNLLQKDVDNENTQLLNLIRHQGIFINHGYFVRNRKDDKILVNENGKLTINPNFDKILANISGFRKKGDLYVTTIRDLLDYWILLEKVSFEYLPDGSINVINHNDKPIKGLSMIIRAKGIQVNGKAPSMKQSGDDTIFWFNMEAHQQITMMAE